MAPLSAFNSRAWKWIRNGWELKEHRDRQRTIEERQRKLAEINRVWDRDQVQQRIEVEKAIKAWPEDPERRARNWQGWWLAKV
jgi:DNA polymerase III subunit gamma/tau